MIAFTYAISGVLLAIVGWLLRPEMGDAPAARKCSAADLRARRLSEADVSEPYAYIGTMSDLVPRPENWLRVTPAGLYCEPGDFHIDPTRPVPRAVITHGHGDHARPGNEHVLATPETVAIMRQRYGELAGGTLQGDRKSV